MEIIEDMDSDLDGAVNLEEYLADIVTDEDEENIIEHERNNFSDNLDLDKNGVLDKEEVILNPTHARNPPISIQELMNFNSNRSKVKTTKKSKESYRMSECNFLHMKDLMSINPFSHRGKVF